MVKIDIQLKAPFATRERDHVRMWNTVVPVIHVAGALGTTRDAVEEMCKKHHIPMAPKPPGALYRNFLDIAQFPKLFRAFGWSEEDVEAGVAQFRDAVRKPYEKPGKRSIVVSSKKMKKKKNSDDDDDDSSSSNRIADDGDSAPAWARELTRELTQHVDDGLEKCFQMVGAQAIPFYFGTSKWLKKEKPAAIQARLDEMMPTLVKQVRADLEKRLTGQVESELRERKRREFEQNLDKEDAEAMVSALRQDKRPTVVVEEAANDNDEDAAAEVQEYLKKYFSKIHTE